MEKAKYDICVIGGLGHVGLPFGLALANAGKTVVLNDINKSAIKTVKSGKMPFKENGADELLPKVLNKTLFVSSDKKVISESNYVVVIIGTPVDEYLNPKYNLLFDFLDGIIEYIKNDQHILLRSTLFPGTTENIKRYFKNAGKKVSISFCPERVLEGNALEELSKFPQIISAFDKKSFQEAELLFKLLTDDVIKVKPIEAELAKVFTNTWRYIQFATANQFYEISTGNGIDFYKIHEAITYKYPRCANLPMAGFAAGPCLFKDTMQLASYSNNSFFLGHSAMLINEGLPNFIIQALKNKYELSEKTIGILGMSFKANSDDKRESLSYKLKKMMEVEAKKVYCSDIYINDKGFVSMEELLQKSDIIILGAPHGEYKDIRFDKNKIVVDIWNYYKRGGLF